MYELITFEFGGLLLHAEREREDSFFVFYSKTPPYARG
jgi:hypothetical protein